MAILHQTALRTCPDVRKDGPESDAWTVAPHHVSTPQPQSYSSSSSSTCPFSSSSFSSSNASRRCTCVSWCNPVQLMTGSEVIQMQSLTSTLSPLCHVAAFCCCFFSLFFSFLFFIFLFLSPSPPVGADEKEVVLSLPARCQLGLFDPTPSHSRLFPFSRASPRD